LWRSGKKTAVEECHRIEASRWQREGILKAGVHLTGSWQWTYQSGSSFSINYEVNTLDLASPTLRLWYSWLWPSTQEKGSADYKLRLTTTQPRFGGLRWWFVCPLVANNRPCERRVGKLHLPPRSSYFGCRHCYELTYTSSQESHKDDRMYRLLSLRMGWDLARVKRAMKLIGKR
jgi:hypothetical protein